MKVILNQDVKGQGKKGDLIEVSDGYARNFLLPKNLAIPATKENINVLKGQQESREYRQQKELEEAQETAKKINEISVLLKAKAGDNGKLFGSITSKEVSEALTSQHHIKIDKEKFMTGSSTESVNITFSNGEDLIDAAGIVLSSTKESELHGVNCYRAVIRNKNTVSLEKVSDGITTVLGEVSIEPILSGEKHNLKLHIYGSRISIYYDSEKIIQYIVPDIFYLSGYAGTYQYGKGIEFGNIVLSN